MPSPYRYQYQLFVQDAQRSTASTGRFTQLSLCKIMQGSPVVGLSSMPSRHRCAPMHFGCGPGCASSPPDQKVDPQRSQSELDDANVGFEHMRPRSPSMLISPSNHILGSRVLMFYRLDEKTGSVHPDFMILPYRPLSNDNYLCLALHQSLSCYWDPRQVGAHSHQSRFPKAPGLHITTNFFNALHPGQEAAPCHRS